jgi:hypothetical protein
MKNENVTATTVKFDKFLYQEFKVLGVRNRLNLQTFVERCVNLYVSESSFRDIVNNVPMLSTSGSYTLP